METIDDDGVRVRFSAIHEGPRSPGLAELGGARVEAVRLMDALGCCPVLNDGLAAGNAAMRLKGGALLVTPSGRRPGQLDPHELVEVVAVDVETWSVRVRSDAPDAAPTSDTFLHHAVLLGVPPEPGRCPPAVSLHGHTLHSLAEARALSLPCSPEETLFSTPEDRAAFVALLERAPYPTSQVWVRRGHGFVLAADDVQAGCDALRDLVDRATALTPG